MQINWTLVAGWATCSLAAAANWDAGTAAGRVNQVRRAPWRVLAIVYLVLLAEMIVETRFGLIAVAEHALGLGRHAAQIAGAGVIPVIAAGALVAIMRTGRRVRLFLPAGLAALALALLFGVEALSLGQAGTLLYRPVGPVLLIAWLWLGLGAAAVGIAALVARGR